jgi:3-methyladenine DNA glycosylase/8-oxoguanine DNA glycosylase
MEPLTTVVRPRLPLRLGLSLNTLRHGPADPTVRVWPGEVWRATRTASGPATVRYAERDGDFVVSAWGPGASACLESAADVLGARDCIDDWEPGRHRLIADLDRQLAGLRMVATGAVFEAIVPTVLEQKVTSEEAHEAWRRMAWRWGEQAPGPGDVPVRLPPSPARLAAEPYYRYHPFGIERKRTDIVRLLASRHKRVEEAATIGRSRLEAFAGVGEWTSAKVAQIAWADADAVPVGDYHLAPIVVYAFTGVRGGDDDAMLELLEPFRPHRGRAARMIKSSYGPPPRRTPRARLRDLRAT